MRVCLYGVLQGILLYIMAVATVFGLPMAGVGFFDAYKYNKSCVRTIKWHTAPAYPIYKLSCWATTKILEEK